MDPHAAGSNPSFAPKLAYRYNLKLPTGILVSGMHLLFHLMIQSLVSANFMK